MNDLKKCVLTSNKNLGFDVCNEMSANDYAVIQSLLLPSKITRFLTLISKHLK